MLVTRVDYNFHMKPRQGQVLNPYQLPSQFMNADNDPCLQWANPDEQFTVQFNQMTGELTGEYYDWDEDAQDWVDGAKMEDDDLTERLVSGEFLVLFLEK